MVMADGWGSKVVFRLRKLPSHISNPRDAAALLGQAFSIPTDQVVIFSLTDTLDRWEDPPSKILTLQLNSRPQCLGDTKASDTSEWPIPVPSGKPNEMIILDTHFKGITVLSSPAPDKHHVE